MRTSTTSLCALLLINLTFSQPADAQFGDVKGQFVLDGDIPKLSPLLSVGPAPAANLCTTKDVPDESLVVNPENKGIANIILFPSRTPKDINPALAAIPEEPAVQDQKDCVFLPHVLVVRVGQTVKAKNDDACAHNVRGTFIRNSSINFVVNAKDRKGVDVEPLEAAEPLPMPIKCDIHPYMTAYWIVADHPYVGVTDADGNFEIKGLPAGEHTFRVWHERAGYLDRSFKINVVAGDVTDIGKTEVGLDKLTK